jgi:outer membrane autotransporter protein
MTGCTGSPLLVPVAVYDSAANVDLTITRIGFGAVSGLTGNQGAVGGGIEAVYNPALTGPFASLLANLFLLDATDYPLALDQLTGAQTGGYLQSLRNGSQQLNTAVADQSDCLTSPEGFEGCRNPETGLRLWMAGGLNSANLDGDANAPGSDASQQFAIVGLDHVADSIRVGGYVGYRDLEVDFDRQNGRIEADGWLLGLRASYDTGDYYLRGVGNFTQLSGSSIRSIGILSTTGIAAGTPDTDTLSLYAEAGARIPVQGTWLTPFIALDYADTDLGAFTETGVPGANLAYADQSVSQTSFLAGLKWTGRLGAIIPEARIAYRSDLGDSEFDVVSRFADAPAGSDFTVRSPSVERGSVLAGFSLTGAFSDRMTGKIGYAGRYGTGIDDQAVYGSVTFRFGGGAL